MNPPPPRHGRSTSSVASTASSSVQYAGGRNPLSTSDFNRRAGEQGVVDLTSLSSSSSTGTRKRNPEYSVPGGKRSKQQYIYTSNLSHYCNPPPPRYGRSTSSVTSTASSSVQYAGGRNPLSTSDFNRRAREQGVVDLTSLSSSRSTGTRKRKPEYSVPGGKRSKQQHIYTSNLSHCCTTLQERFDQGAFRWVHKGQYTPDPRIPGDTGGPQNGQLCVLKEFKTGSVYEDSFFQQDMQAVDTAAEIINSFNRLNIPGGIPIQLNRPTVWYEIYPDSTGNHKRKLVEPMLEGKFLKFNSNSGYTNGAAYMQALSHFSYAHTGGHRLLCDLQGARYDDMYVLTDPVIMSKANIKQFGPGDLGMEGIENFFAHHKCNRFCRNWTKPVRPQISIRIPCAASTSFSLTVGMKESLVDRKLALDLILAKSRW